MRYAQPFHEPCRPLLNPVPPVSQDLCADGRDCPPFATKHSTAALPPPLSLLARGESLFHGLDQKAIAFLPFLPGSDVAGPMRSSDLVGSSVPLALCGCGSCPLALHSSAQNLGASYMFLSGEKKLGGRLRKDPSR